MNYTKPIAKALGVDTGEVFGLTGYEGFQFRITENGLECNFAGIPWFLVPDRTIREIITGKAEIVKLEVEQ